MDALFFVLLQRRFVWIDCTYMVVRSYGGGGGREGTFMWLLGYIIKYTDIKSTRVHLVFYFRRGENPVFAALVGVYT